MGPRSFAGWLLVAVVCVAASAARDAHAQPADRDRWVALASGGFAIPEGRTAGEMLLEMAPLLASSDPVLRDDVAYTAAERWILRERRLPPDDLRRVRDRWMQGLEKGLGGRGADAVFERSFSALCLSLVAAADLQAPFMDPPEVEAFLDRILDYFAREQDLRGFDDRRGWMHTVAHTADVLKFLARNPRLPAGTDARILAAVDAKLESAEAVFAWGENDRLALAVHAAVRRADADRAALEAWTTRWVERHHAMWSKGPQVEPVAFARVENAKQVLRSLHAALSMDAAPTTTGAAAAQVVLAALRTMR